MPEAQWATQKTAKPNARLMQLRLRVPHGTTQFASDFAMSFSFDIVK